MSTPFLYLQAVGTIDRLYKFGHLFSVKISSFYDVTHTFNTQNNLYSSFFMSEYIPSMFK